MEIGGSWFETSPGKMFIRLSNQEKLGMVTCACHSSYGRSTNKRITCKTCLGKTHKTLAEKSKKGMECDSSGRAPTNQAQEPEFKS
jgi:hypothetical protein